MVCRVEAVFVTVVVLDGSSRSIFVAVAIFECELPCFLETTQVK